MNAFRLWTTSAHVTAMVIALGACRQAVRDEQITRVRATEDSVRPFSPAYAQDTTRRHVALFFRFAAGQFTLDPAAPAVRPGNLPYRAPRQGGFEVRYLDANGRTLGTYAIEDPTTVRSCDVSGDRAGEVRPLPTARIELLVPFDGRIAFVELTSPTLKTQRHDVRAALQRATGRPQ